MTVNGAVAHLSERRAVFPLAELEREALTRGRDAGVTLDDVRKEVGSRDDLVLADRSNAVAARVTTAKAIEDDRWLLGAVERSRGRGPALLARDPVDRLGQDQLKVVRHILGSPDRLVAVEGRAGSGKTTALAYVRQQAEGAGWRVRGFAPTTTAVDGLRECRIDAVTVAAALMESLSLNSQSHQLWIVDEAGLLSTRQARDLLDRAERVGAKVALVGDRQQHRAVEAGSPFALLIDRAGIATEWLDVIRRQKEARLRETVRAASEVGGAGRAVQLLEQAGRVVEIADPKARHAAIARDFVTDGGRGVVIAPTNAERIDLNRRIREALIEAGRVERVSIKACVVVRQDLTAEQRGRALSYSVGDVVRFARGGGGIEACERARVVSLNERKNLLRLQLESGLARVINPKERRGFEVERVEQRRFAVGDRVQFRERHRSLDVANGTIGTIKKLDPERGFATIDVAGRSVRLDLKVPSAVDHAYAVTSHRSQGLSRERVYLTVDTSRSEELVNQARTRYLDTMTREQLSGAEQEVLKLGEEVQAIARHLNDCLVQMPVRLAEADAHRWNVRERRERWRMAPGAPGDAARGLPGWPGRQLSLWRDGEREAAPSGRDDERHEERAVATAPARNQAEGTRALSRERAAPAVERLSRERDEGRER